MRSPKTRRARDVPSSASPVCVSDGSGSFRVGPRSRGGLCSPASPATRRNQLSLGGGGPGGSRRRLLIDPGGVVVFANARWRELLSVEGNELVGGAFERIVHPDGRGCRRQSRGFLNWKATT